MRFSDPSIETVVVMSSAQVGKTEIINNVIGFHIHQDPAPILLVQPTIEMAETWSKDRLAPMLRDTPALTGLGEGPSQPGFGEHAPAEAVPWRPDRDGRRELRSVACLPARAAGAAGRGGSLPAVCRDGRRSGRSWRSSGSTTFWNRKVILTSTPTTKGASRIEAAWEESDQRTTRCPARLRRVPGAAVGAGQVRPGREGEAPSDVRYECEHCRAQLTEPDKHRMIRNGRWVITRPWIERTAGFHINELYSPWSTWGSIVENFLEAKKRPETLRVWVNTSLGETWEEEGITVDDAALGGRREDYGIGDPLPEGILLLTAGVDVQGDRIEATAWGFGLGRGVLGGPPLGIPGEPGDLPAGMAGSGRLAPEDLAARERQHAADRLGLRGLRRPCHAAGVRLLPQAGVAAHLGDHRAVRGGLAAA